jgi:GT2 family glycosyltransferase
MPEPVRMANSADSAGRSRESSDSFSPKNNTCLDVSAIVLTRHRPDRCLDSVWHNALAMQKTRGEILVVNNGTDPVQIPPTLAGIRCKVIQMPTNAGAAARNVGLRKSSGEFLLMLDDDAYLDPGLVELMIKSFREDPKIGAVAFHIQNADREEGCLLPTVFHGCACGFRRRVLDEVGGYPEGYLYYGEEYDLTFRLYQAGYRIAWLPPRRKVRHERDACGRHVDRILRLLVRNNAYLWFRFFPWRHIPSALMDTLQRYALVARKEGVRKGFLMGLAQLPPAVARGLWQRRPLNDAVFKTVSLLGQVEDLSRSLRRRGVAKVIVCGVGKFPSLWLKVMRKHNLEVAAFWDFNPCWRGQRIQGIPVTVVEEEVPGVDRECCLIVGTTSFPENLCWSERLRQELGMSRLDRAEQEWGEEEEFSRAGKIAPLESSAVRAFRLSKPAISSVRRNGMPIALTATR